MQYQAYCVYSQRRQPGWIGGRMSSYLRIGALASYSGGLETGNFFPAPFTYDLVLPKKWGYKGFSDNLWA
jgi:hypothetical protein